MKNDRDQTISPINPIWNVLALALAIVIFVIDLSLPKGIMSGIPYFFVLWLTYFSRSPKSVATSVTVCVLLTLLGFFYSPDGSHWSVSLANRTMTSLVLAISGLFVYLAMKWQSRLQSEIASAHQLADELAQQYESSRNQSRALASVMEDLTKERERLQQARDVAERASRARGEFLANMSHEIRTPMAAILGYVDIVADGTEDADNLQALDTIRRNGRHLLQIINDILDLSKIDAGKLSIATEMANISEIVGEIRSIMDVRATENQIHLDFEFTNDIPEQIETDSLRLRQILLNIIGNAIKFTQRGKVTVSTSYRQADNMLAFDVRDTGIGISKTDLEKLFQPFSQVDASSTREYEGTGLGLVISRRLALALGGDLTVESELGQGSTFTLTIACGNVSEQRSRPNPVISPKHFAPNKESYTPIEGTILVVDDRRDIRFLAQHLIERVGGTVLLANNGQEAVKMMLDKNASTLAQQAPQVDLVLMDMQMPVMDGYEATRVLRKAGFSKPIIALTANAMTEDRDKCLAAGCDDFITKPIDSRKLVQLLHKLLDLA